MSAVKHRFAALAGQSERDLLIGTVLLGTAISAATVFILIQYYGVDALSSLFYVPQDCMANWGENVGRHCFSDYALPAGFGMRANPWDPYPVYLPPDFKPAMNNYPAAGMLPHLIFGLLGQLLSAPRVGLFGYLFALTVACLTPAVWSARGARGMEQVVVFLVCGAAAVPVWMAVDRGNSVGFVVPIALALLVALCRRRWGLVAIMAVLAALVKPQFALLVVALFAARQWRLGCAAAVGTIMSNLAAYVLWPRDFPHTIIQSIHNTFGYGSPTATVNGGNVSFGKGLLTIPDTIKGFELGGPVPDSFLAGPRSTIGYAVLAVVVVSVLVLGERIPPVMTGIVLLATASLFPPLSCRYYLVFVLPVAALVLRDPCGPPATGIFDRYATVGGRRRTVGVWVSLASAVSIAQIALPSPSVRVPITSLLGDIETFVNLVVTTVLLTPLLWLGACAAIIVSYARRPASPRLDSQELAVEVSFDGGVGTSSAAEPRVGSSTRMAGESGRAIRSG